MNVKKIEVKLSDIEGSASALSGGILEMLDMSVAPMNSEQGIQFLAMTLSGILGGLAGRIGVDATLVLLETLPKILRDSVTPAMASAQRRH